MSWKIHRSIYVRLVTTRRFKLFLLYQLVVTVCKEHYIMFCGNSHNWHLGHNLQEYVVVVLERGQRYSARYPLKVQWHMASFCKCLSQEKSANSSVTSCDQKYFVLTECFQKLGFLYIQYGTFVLIKQPDFVYQYLAKHFQIPPVRF